MSTAGSCDLTHPYDVICKVLGGFVVYATISSILWTSGIAIYLYCRVVINRNKVIRVLVLVCDLLGNTLIVDSMVVP